MKMMRTHIATAGALLLFAGCIANPYSQYFTENPALLFGSASEQVVHNTGDVRIVRIQGLTKELSDNITKEGFVQLGVSTFTSAGRVTESMVRAHAKEIGAGLVFVEERYSHSEKGVAAVTSYKPGTNVTTTTSGNISAYGTGGAAFGNYSGTTTTTSSGTIETTYVPATYRHVQYSAFFYARRKQ